jgi:N-acetylglucosaminyl-diphospho-decaprenol L-rhamnosyltransferase
MSVPSPSDQLHLDREGYEPRIYVVVPVYNRRNLVNRFLIRLGEQTFRNFTTIVIDDGSTDGSTALIREKFPEVQVLRGDGNLWWTGAINVGIRRAMLLGNASDAILVINDDLEFEPNYLESLYRVWQSTPNTLVGSVLVDVNDPERIFRGGELVNRWTAKSRHLNTGRKLGEFGKGYQVEVSSLTGQGALVPIHVFRSIGLYDDKHFQQCGDTELPVRAKNRGYRLIVSYGAVVKARSDEIGINHASFYSLRDAKEYFFGVKSNCRLKYRFFFAYDTATSVAAFFSFLLFDIARLTIHFLRRLKFSGSTSFPG